MVECLNMLTNVEQLPRSPGRITRKQTEIRKDIGGNNNKIKLQLYNHCIVHADDLYFGANITSNELYGHIVNFLKV